MQHSDLCRPELCRLGVAAAVAVLFAAGVPSGAADAATTLRIADSLPSGSYIQEFVTEPFMKAVEERTGGEIQFKYFPGQQLGKAKDMLSLTQSGVAEIGYIGPSYVKDKMPLTAVIELPNAFSDDSCEGFAAFWELTHGDGFLNQQEWATNDVIPVVTFVTRHHLYISKDKTIDSLADIKGLKIRAPGGAVARTASELGTVPVNLTAPETYESMSRGTIDGAIWPARSAFDYGLVEHIKSGTVNKHYAGVALTYAMSTKAFNALSEEQQKIILDVGHEVTMDSCKKFDAEEQRAIARMTDELGIRQIHFSEADEELIDEAFTRSTDAWAKDLDDRGRPGTETVEALRAAVANYGR